MKKILVLMSLAVCLGACSGMPPAWWNPGNTYSSTSRQSVSDEKPRERVITPSAIDESQIPSEESISVADESYEEMMITPLQDEETEEVTGEASSQSVPQERGELPPPSVLE